MSFVGRPWLVDIYKDRNPNKVIMKSVQCGISEYAVVHIMGQLMKGKSILYILPTLEARNDFVDNRINRLVEAVPLYRAGSFGTDNKGLKFYWNGVIKFVGSNVRMGFREFPAQVIIYDELDICDQDIIKFAKDRLAASGELGFVPAQLQISNPTVPKYGIDLAYEESDKKWWYIKCAHDNKRQSLNWFDNVVDPDTRHPFLMSESMAGEPEMVCRSCHKPIDRLGSGEWVAEHPSSSNSGYQISKLFTRQATMGELLANYEKGKVDNIEMQRVYNSDWGLPYSGGEAELTLEVFSACAKAGYQLPLKAENSVAGIDVGGILHIRVDALIEGRRQMVYCGTVPTFEDIPLLLKRFGVRVYVIDARPEMHKVAEFIAANRGGWACDFHPDTSIQDMKIDRKALLIKVNRTRAIDEATQAYFERQIILPENWRTLDRGDWLKQMMASVRIIDMKRKPPAFVWDEKGQPDHHRLADCYCHQAAKLAGFGRRSMEVQWI